MTTTTERVATPCDPPNTHECANCGDTIRALAEGTLVHGSTGAHGCVSNMTTTIKPNPQKAAGTWFDGFMIGMDKADQAAELRAAIRHLYDAFDGDDGVDGDPIDDAERAAFVMRTVIAISVEEVHRRAYERVELDI